MHEPGKKKKRMKAGWHAEIPATDRTLEISRAVDGLSWAKPNRKEAKKNQRRQVVAASGGKGNRSLLLSPSDWSPIRSLEHPLLLHFFRFLCFSSVYPNTCLPILSTEILCFSILCFTHAFLSYSYDFSIPTFLQSHDRNKPLNSCAHPK